MRRKIVGVDLNHRATHERSRSAIGRRKIKALRPERIAEVEDFVDFLKARDEAHSFIGAAGALAEDSLQKIWDNADAADYDRL